MGQSACVAALVALCRTALRFAAGRAGANAAAIALTTIAAATDRSERSTAVDLVKSVRTARIAIFARSRTRVFGGVELGLSAGRLVRAVGKGLRSRRWLI